MVFTSAVFREEVEKNWTYVQYICVVVWNYGGAETRWNFWEKRDGCAAIERCERARHRTKKSLINFIIVWKKSRTDFNL